MMEVDVVAEELAADGMMAELAMHQRLPKRHDQMRSNGGHEVQRKLRNEPRYRLEHELFLPLKEPI
jgi:adenylate kinase